ncbi:ABC transporter permease [Pseudofrankia sp. BMG5.37]|uniref:ABC transporter permease n=1 Tax=Pseudofrankia sp. BMG5.37 TaxID=3050035 RepID=UPI0028948982|nr:ABC transporter permease [Pseudofrankia sp. BMG5.37]MDT3439246.1 ABC transporter permease [Pseudofrankia sp. BMG5.37]
MSTATLTQMSGSRVTLPRVMHMEWIKFWSLRSTIYTLAVALLVTVGIGTLSTALVDFKANGPAANDPTWDSLYGITIAALATAVLGVLMTTSEYGTGTIRATLAAVPARLPVLWAKVAVFAAGSFIFTFAAGLAAFLAGQAILSARDLDSATLFDPGAFRAVVGAAVYLTGAGLIGVAIGSLLRHTAGAITAVIGALFLAPSLLPLLPGSIRDTVNPYMPLNAAQAFITVNGPGSGDLSPWAGLAVYAGYLVVLVVWAAVMLKRRDA